MSYFHLGLFGSADLARMDEERIMIDNLVEVIKGRKKLNVCRSHKAILSQVKQLNMYLSLKAFLLCWFFYSIFRQWQKHPQSNFQCLLARVKSNFQRFFKFYYLFSIKLNNFIIFFTYFSWIKQLNIQLYFHSISFFKLSLFTSHTLYFSHQNQI